MPSNENWVSVAYRNSYSIAFASLGERCPLEPHEYPWASFECEIALEPHKYPWASFEGEIALYRCVRQENEAFSLEVKLVCVMLNSENDFHKDMVVGKLKFGELQLAR